MNPMHRRARARTRIAALVAVAAVGMTMASTTAGAARPREHHGTRTRIDHVFTIVLENYKAEDVTPTAAPFLTALGSKGVTLDAMYGIDHASLSNYIGMTSGLSPTPATKADCFQYDCIFEPPTDANIADQLEAAGRGWKAYMDSMPAPCAHPTESGKLDPYLVGYATRHNPFVYYRSIVGPDIATTPDRCAQHDVPFTQFGQDLRHHHVGNYTFISPNTCNDGHDRGETCALPTADHWLAWVVPAILRSEEYRHHGALIITFDESEGGDTRGCCGNSAGGKIATLVLSPAVTNPGSHSTVPYNHYSVLRTEEDLFGLPCLGHACDASVQPFGPDVWSVRNRHVHS